MQRKKPFVRCLCLPETPFGVSGGGDVDRPFLAPAGPTVPSVRFSFTDRRESARAISWRCWPARFRSKPRGTPLPSCRQETFNRWNSTASEIIDQAHHSDLWIVEDLQHLPLGASEALVQVLEYRLTRRLPAVITAQLGPRQLAPRPTPNGSHFPARLTSRLTAGLVVALGPWQAESRLLFFEELAQIWQFAVDPGILKWLADNLPGSGRVLTGALHQLEILARQQRRPLDLATVQRHFRRRDRGPSAHGRADRPARERLLSHETRTAAITEPVSQHYAASANQHVPGPQIDRAIAGADRRLLRRPRSHHGPARLPQDGTHSARRSGSVRDRPSAACPADVSMPVEKQMMSCRPIVLSGQRSKEIGDESESSTGVSPACRTHSPPKERLLHKQLFDKHRFSVRP